MPVEQPVMMARFVVIFEPYRLGRSRTSVTERSDGPAAMRPLAGSASGQRLAKNACGAPLRPSDHEIATVVSTYGALGVART